MTQSLSFSGLYLSDEPSVLEGLEGDGQVNILCSTRKDVIPVISSNEEELDVEDPFLIRMR